MIGKLLSDILYPKRCVGCKKIGTLLCSGCFSKISFNDRFICPICLKPSVDGLTHPGCFTPLSLDGLFSAVMYKGIIKKVMYQFKYAPYLTSLEEIIGKLMYEGFIQNEIFMHVLEDSPVLVPVPLHKNRIKKRGYNHAQIISHQVNKYFSLEEIEILRRVKNTRPQYRLSKEQRRQNILGAFGIDAKKKGLLTGKTVLLVDDIATTCFTLRECAKILKRNGTKKVYAITFAKEN